MRIEQEVSHVMQACGLDRDRAFRHVIACERFRDARIRRDALTTARHEPPGTAHFSRAAPLS